MPPPRRDGSTIPATRRASRSTRRPSPASRSAATLQARFAPDIELSGALDLAVRVAAVPCRARRRDRARRRGRRAGRTRPSPPPCRRTWRSTSPSTPRRSTSALPCRRPMRSSISRSPAACCNLDLVEAGFAGGTSEGRARRHAPRRRGGGVAPRRARRAATCRRSSGKSAGLPAASGKLDLSFEATGRGRSMSGIVSTLGGSGSFSIDEGRLNALNADALDRGDGGGRGREGARRGGGARDLRAAVRLGRAGVRPRRRLVLDHRTA